MSTRMSALKAVAILAVGFTIGAVGIAPAMDTNYANTSHASQMSYDSFNYSVRKRLDAVRSGETVRDYGRYGGYGTYSAAPLYSSDAALGMAPATVVGPATRTATYAPTRRQLDCVYYNGFTVWGDMYQTWSRQRSRNGESGYKYRTTGPAIGFDWSSEVFTIGLATTFNWGKLKGVDLDHTLKTRTWAVELYGQWNTPRFYVNTTLGYSRNRYKGNRHDGPLYQDAGEWVNGNGGDKYYTNAWNADAEFGYKFDFNCFRVTPHIGLRYFHDRRNSINEGGNIYNVRAGHRYYHVLELPVGVDLSYEFAMGGSVLIPKIRAGWTPELIRRRSRVSGSYEDVNGAIVGFNDNAPKRARNGFVLGAGLEAKITKSISAHIDYNCNFRSRQYEHHWNAGVGFTF